MRTWLKVQTDGELVLIHQLEYQMSVPQRKLPNWFEVSAKYALQFMIRVYLAIQDCYQRLPSGSSVDCSHCIHVVNQIRFTTQLWPTRINRQSTFIHITWDRLHLCAASSSVFFTSGDCMICKNDV